MSTIAVNAITNAAGGNTATINGMTPTADSLQGFRNRIINGGMGIWQRGTSGFTTLGNYSSDRWFVNAGTSLSAVSRSTDVPAGFQFSISVAGTNVVQLLQRVESLNCFDLAGQDVTISFWAKQTSGAGSSSLFLQLFHPNATDNYAGTTQIGSNQFFTGTSGWVQYSVTFSNIPAGAANGLQVTIGANTAGAATFLIAGVQLEAGSVATPFERRPYGTELALCQRYAFQLNNQTGSNQSARYGFGVANAAAQMQSFVIHPVTMRTIPSVTVTNIGSFVASDTTAGIVPTSISQQTNVSSPQASCLSVVVSSGLTVYRPYFLEGGAAPNGQLLFSAEL